MGSDYLISGHWMTGLTDIVRFTSYFVTKWKHKAWINYLNPLMYYNTLHLPISTLLFKYWRIKRIYGYKMEKTICDTKI